jgi:hypothetical protein
LGGKARTGEGAQVAVLGRVLVGEMALETIALPLAASICYHSSVQQRKEFVFQKPIRPVVGQAVMFSPILRTAEDGASKAVIGGSSAGVAGQAVAVDEVQVVQGNVGAGGDLEDPRHGVAADGGRSGGHTLDGHVPAHDQLAMGQHDGVLDGRGQQNGVAALGMGDGVAERVIEGDVVGAAGDR